MTTIQGELFSPQNAEHVPSEVLSWGLGADSTVMVTLLCCRRGP